jgi:glutamate 5-kinase
MVALPILVVKVGTHALLGTHEEPGVVFGYLACNIHTLMSRYRIVLVTSGAIGFGVRALTLDGRPGGIEQLQALAMIGQAGLLRRWREAFGTTMIGQVLVTRRDLTDGRAAQALHRSIEAVWAYGAIPIVNENDAISHEEISFGDNDQLAAEIAAGIGASSLVLITDQDGIQSAFGTTEQARIATINLADAESYIVPARSALGKGGLNSKVLAAGVALGREVDVYIGRVVNTHSVDDILTGKTGTRIVQ